MEASPANRRLAAILAADIAGYSRLMEENEEATLRTLSTYRAAISDLVAEHGGRIFGTAGDSVIIEFASAVHSVRAAVAIQRTLERHNADLPVGRRMEFRIGINVGDVVEQDGDIFGDGVNIAARLEGIAEPGGICVSQRVHEDAEGKAGVAFEDIGERTLKNIARPVRVYRLRTPAAKQRIGSEAESKPHSIPDKPSIAVLPFDNLSGDPQQLYFSDGITEDIITELSRFRSLFVIARNSSFAFRGRQLGIVEVGRQLGVQFVLEGSVRKSGNRVRITAQLIETAAARHLWAERYDRDLSDLFILQDEVVSTIVATIAGRLDIAAIERAKRKPAASLAAYDCLLRGMEFLAGYDSDANINAISMFEKSIALDPGYAIGHAYLGLSLYVKGIHGDPDFRRALEEATRGVELDADDSRCHRILAEVSLECGLHERADFHSQRSLALNPNDAHAAAYRAYILTCLGRSHEATDWIGTAMRLNPFYPDWYRNTQAHALHSAGNHAEAIRVYELLAQPRFFHHAYMAACYAKLGDGRRSQVHKEKTLALKPDFSAAAWVAQLPFAREEDRSARLQELADAGLP